MPITSPKICVIDYGMGNLQSVCNAIEFLGSTVNVLDDPKMFRDVDAIVLPGVGAFSKAMANLQKRNLIDPMIRAVLDESKPLLGICLGMQLLADRSQERGVCRGLSLIPGEVREIPVSKKLKLPHIGWNSVSISKCEPLFCEINDESSFYFVHSYHFECDLVNIAGVADYGAEITAAVQKEHIFGVQFHPERSQKKGLRLLRNFVDFVNLTINEDRA